MKLSRAQFNQWFSQYLTHRAEDLAREIRWCNDDIAVYAHAISMKMLYLQAAETDLQRKESVENIEENNKKIEEVKEKIKLLSARLKTFSEPDQETYTRLYKHNFITGITKRKTKQGSILYITTKPVTLKRQQLGRFNIQIKANSNPGVYTIRNLDFIAQTYDHPNISNGRPCLGGYFDVVRDFDTKGHLYLVIDALIQFLRYGYGDGYTPYISLTDWVARKQTRVI